MKNGVGRHLCFGTLGLILFATSAFSASHTRAFKLRDAEAPKTGMLPGYWSSGVKDYFGTAYESYDSQNGYSANSSTAPISKVWFTGAQGVLTEVYWPTVDMAQVRDSQLLATDGKSAFFEERNNLQTSTEWVENGVPAFKTVTRDPQGKFLIERTIVADPDRDVVFQHLKITRFVSGLKFFVLHNPSVANTPLGDNAMASLGDSPGAGLYAWQDTHAQALLASVPLKGATASFEGTPQDGFYDLRSHFNLTANYKWAHDGNVTLTGWLDIPETVGQSELDLALGFGASIEDAHDVATESLHAGFGAILIKYTDQWREYQAKVMDLSSRSRDGGKLFRSSVAVMKSMEDKTYAGAFIASPAIPWGLNQKDSSDGFYAVKNGKRQMMSGYHLIWPRDLYQMATSFMAMGDFSSAVASLNYLRGVQYGSTDGTWEFGPHKHAKDGSFPQNCWVDGTNHWGGVQLDEVSMPVVLAYRLWKVGQIQANDYWDMVRRAADFIADFGPWTPQERWEEMYGVSTSTTAAEIAALRDASVLAQKAGDTARADRYRKLSESWANSIEKWLFTTTGKYGDGRYYVRIEGTNRYDQPIDPEDEETFKMSNSGGVWREKDVIDGGFLELVRFGVRKALKPEILATLPKYDSTIRVDVSGKGPSFRRYTGDRYNYDESTNQQTLGMPWPILTGERGHYELQKALESGANLAAIERAVLPYLKAMESFATGSHMLPEQVWDYGRKAGDTTGAATPLGWAHGEYVKLLRSRLDGKVFDLQN